MKVLVVFDTKYGATAEIANRIGDGIRLSGASVTTTHAKVSPPPDDFDGVVIGSAVYIGGWRRHAKKYLLTHANNLSQKKVWLFSSGPTGKGNPVELLKGWTFPENLKLALNTIKPVETAVFHGAVFTEKLNFIDRWLAGKVKSPIGDYRDWEAIDAFATRIGTGGSL